MQLGALAHAITARHVTCEHGELVDSQPGHGGSNGADVARFDRGIATDHEGHEHCVFANALCSGRMLPTAVVTAIVPDVAISTYQLPATPEILGVAPYRIAPKTSPPA